MLRIWHYKLLEVLPDLQFKGQLRELVVIMRDWRDKGKTNHILINAVKNKDTICPCKQFREQTTIGECHCGRYVKIDD